mgnify:CR=1 FL=1
MFHWNEIWATRFPLIEWLYWSQTYLTSTSSASGSVLPLGIQIGVGVRTDAVGRITEQGSITATQNPYDLAINGRGYLIDDTLQVNLFGVCSAFLSTVVFILYLQSEKVKELYRNPEILWALSPVYLYWISRIWILSTRGKVQEDPVVFVMKDWVTYIVAALCGLIMWIATKGWLP